MWAGCCLDRGKKDTVKVACFFTYWMFLSCRVVLNETLYDGDVGFRRLRLSVLGSEALGWMDGLILSQGVAIWRLLGSVFDTSGFGSGASIVFGLCGCRDFDCRITSWLAIRFHCAPRVG